MRILLIEDDVDLSNGIALQLQEHNYNVDCCYSGEDALSYALSSSYDVIVLDRMLPVVDGLSILQSLRKKELSVPVILVTAMSGINDRVDGLDAGADDYLVKPFAMEELVARIRALTRRSGKIANNDTLSFSDITLLVTEQSLQTSTETYTLSRKETELLEYFMKNTGITLTREHLLSRIWGPYNDVESGNLDNYIYFLRRRLKLSKSQVTIKTVYGTGYRMEE